MEQSGQDPDLSTLAGLFSPQAGGEPSSEAPHPTPPDPSTISPPPLRPVGAELVRELQEKDDKMNNKGFSVLAVAIALGALALSVYTIVHGSNRYSIVAAGNNIAYKIDCKTGQTWLLAGNREVRCQEQ